MKLLLKLGVYALAVWIAVQIVDGLEFTGDWLALVGIALILGLVNAVVKPIVKLLSLPLVVLTLGLFALVVNAAMFALTIAISRQFDLGLDSTGFGATFLGALIVSLVVWVFELLFRDDKSHHKARR